ncbi:hypothetical protein [Coleofasciculus sp. E2-BRE-01]|uniref:hypothetical protein n=1 Tax=Coleofasciculus sp. E2-BRE-01 TaxID=3069524 RepID=UPI0032FCC989
MGSEQDARITRISPLLTRQGSLVTVNNAKNFHISESSQKAFIDLINVLEDDEYLVLCLDKITSSN